MGFSMPSNTSASSYVEQPGWYHCAINDFKVDPAKKDGTGVFDGVVAELHVLDGTEGSQKKRIFSAYLNNPSPSHKDGGEFAAAVMVRFAKAICIPATVGGKDMPWDKVPAGQDVDGIDWVVEGGRTPIGRQVIVKLTFDKENRIRLDGKHVYHVDDPDVDHVPKSAGGLKLIDKSMRLEKQASGSTAATTTTTAAKSNGNGSKPAGQSAAAAVAAAGNIDDMEL